MQLRPLEWCRICWRVRPAALFVHDPVQYLQPQDVPLSELFDVLDKADQIGYFGFERHRRLRDCGVAVPLLVVEFVQIVLECHAQSGLYCPYLRLHALDRCFQFFELLVESSDERHPSTRLCHCGTW